jgi:MFS family permease
MHVSLEVRNTAFVALLVGMLLAQLDGTVVVAALPAIAADLGQPTAIAGVSAAYLLTVTVSTPVHGRLGDLLGRRTAFACALLLFALGSALCALAPTFPALVAARAVQGIGGGGLVVAAVTGIGELFGPAERIRRQVWVSAVFGISALAGPPVGALLAAGPGWRWAFLANLPLCAAALLVGVRALPGRRAVVVPGFDFAGTVLVVVGGTCVVALGSIDALPVVVAVSLAVGAVLVGGLFVLVERRSPAPLVPPALFARPVLARTIAVTALAGVALFGSFPFVPLAVAAATGADTAAVGALLVALTGGQLLVGLVFAGVARRWSRMVPWGRLGLALGALGLALLAAAASTGWAGSIVPGASIGAAEAIAVVVGLVLTGAALGLCLQAYTLLGQASAPPDAFGAAMATLTFARQLGGALGAACLGLLLVPAGLPAVLVAAAAVLVGALLLAPGRGAEPAAAS